MGEAARLYPGHRSGRATVNHIIEQQRPNGTWTPEVRLVHLRYWTEVFVDVLTCHHTQGRSVRLRSTDGRVLLVVSR